MCVRSLQLLETEIDEKKLSASETKTALFAPQPYQRNFAVYIEEFQAQNSPQPSGQFRFQCHVCREQCRCR